MKIAVLIEGSNKNIEDLEFKIRGKTDLNLMLVSTASLSKEGEYQYLLRCLKAFSKSGSDILLAKFSGREDLIRELGDESSEMIVSLSSNKNSKFYAENLGDIVLDLAERFKKGDYNNGITIKKSTEKQSVP